MLTHLSSCRYKGTKKFQESCQCALKLKDAQAFGKDFVNFILKNGSQVFTTTKILQMNRVCDKLTKMYIAQLAYSK